MINSRFFSKKRSRVNVQRLSRSNLDFESQSSVEKKKEDEKKDDEKKKEKKKKKKKEEWEEEKRRSNDRVSLVSSLDFN